MRRIVLTLVLAVAICVGVMPVRLLATLPATEPCASAGLGSGGVTWTQQTNTVGTTLNECFGVAGDYARAFDSGNTYGNDQYCQFVFRGGSFAGCSLRASGTAGSAQGYNALVGQAGSSRIQIFTSGSPSSIGANDCTEPSVGDTVRFEISGSSLTVKINGTTACSRTDSTIGSGGAAGIVFYDSNARLDDWEGGNLSAGATPTCNRLFQLLGIGGCR